MRGRRHLVFANQNQLDILCRSKSWYMDSTFILCCTPFHQLLTINAFVKSDDCTKQVPLLFAVMTGRKKQDYRVVPQTVISLMPVMPAVRKVTLDFEKALWSVIRDLLPNAEIMGCVVHWTPAVGRKVSFRNTVQILFVTLHRTLMLKVIARSRHACTTRLVCFQTRICA